MSSAWSASTSSAATEHGTRPLLQSTVDRDIPRQRSSAGHWWEQYEDPENAQPYWVNTTTGEYFHVGQQSSSSSLAATVNRRLASGSVTDELGAATEHTPAPPPQPVLYDFAIGQTLSKRSGSRLRSELLKPLIAEYVGQHVEGRDIEIDLTTQRPYPWQEVMAGQGLPRGLRVVRCTARFFSEEADSNTEPKFEPRLDVVLYLDDGTYARYHPGIKLIYSNHKG